MSAELDGNQKTKLPGAVGSLVLGILSLVLGCFYVGFILGVIGLVLGSKAKKAYRANPDNYDGYGMAQAGWICSLIGTIVGSIYVVYIIIVVVIIGAGAGSAGLMEALEGINQ